MISESLSLLQAKMAYCLAAGDAVDSAKLPEVGADQAAASDLVRAYVRCG